MNSNSISQQSPSYAKIYAPKNEQLAVWNEGGDEDQSAKPTKAHMSRKVFRARGVE